MIDKYIAYIRDVRRYSPRTQTLYADALKDFAEWAGMPDLIGHLIPSRLREYEAHLIERGLKPRTVHLHMSALSGYCNFLIKEGVLKSNPVRGIKRPKMEKRIGPCCGGGRAGCFAESEAGRQAGLGAL